MLVISYTSWRTPQISKAVPDAMLTGAGKNHQNEHFLQFPGLHNVARCYFRVLVPEGNSAMLDFVDVPIYIYVCMAFSGGQKLKHDLSLNESQPLYNTIRHLSMCNHIPLVPHKAMAEVSRIGNL